MSMQPDISKCTTLCKGIIQKNAKTYYIQCTIAGTWHYCNADRLDKLIKKHGTKEKIGLTYISRDAKPKKTPKIKAPRLSKVARRSKELFEDMDNPEGPKRSYTFLPKPPAVSTLLTGANVDIYGVFSDNGTKCIRPDLIKRNIGWCNGCKWYNICAISAKEWKKYAEQHKRLGAFREVQFTGIIYPTEGEDIRNQPQINLYRDNN